ncbi:MAG: peptide chain release factor aRF-1 [Candidatus Aenigmarchaeota archaeon]|nr:peptide chain release factor aRF-1 [Candidatus Aenigmarchaeota archaeon]
MSNDTNYKLKKLLKELESKRGRHTELISLYIPKGYSLNEIMTLLSNEISLTQNVKSKTVRKNVTDALTKIMQHLKTYKKTPENGLAIFCGNVSEQEGKTDIELWAVEPPEPLGIKLYWCDQKFELQPLRDMVKEKDVYGLVVLDANEATIGILKGKQIQVKKHLKSIVPGKFIKGGQSQMRFQRVREGLLNDWLKTVAENVKKFLSDTKGIIIGGGGPVKDNFYNKHYLPTELEKKVIGIKDVGYTDEHGLQELLNRSEDLLQEAAVSKEKKILKKFFDNLNTDSGMVVYGLDAVIDALQKGAVETILISEDLDYFEGEFICECGNSFKKIVKNENIKCPKCGSNMKLIGKEDIIDAIEEIVKNYGTEVIIISRTTSEGEQFYNIGGIGAILRYKI